MGQTGNAPIKTEGFYLNQPLAGYVAKEGDQQIIYYYDGHRRHEAALLAISEGAELSRIPVVVTQSGVNLEDLTVALVRANSGQPLSPYETAIVCKRLARFGWASADISQRLGLTLTYVADLLLLAAAPLGVRNMVIEDRVAATTAIQAIKKYGEKALDELLKAERRANASGKSKVTGRHIPGGGYLKVLRKSADTLAGTIASVKNDPAYESLSPDVRQQIEDLLSRIEAAREADAQADAGTTDRASEAA